MAEAEFETDSSVRGYHVYQDNWTPVIGERFHCEQSLFSNCEAGKVSMVKHSRFAKIRENRESFPPRMFWRIRYLACKKQWLEVVGIKEVGVLKDLRVGSSNFSGDIYNSINVTSFIYN